MELSVIIVNRWKPLTIITKCSILDVATVLDSPLNISLADINVLINYKVQNNFLMLMFDNKSLTPFKNLFTN